MQQRIQTVDGLRFMAALGVLWIHSWTAAGNPRCYIGFIDLADLLAIGGNGVDLFFVISGFCMYYFYAAKSQFSYDDFYRFIVKRWVRLSPAFYTATIVYILASRFQHVDDSVFLLLNSLFYLNAVFPNWNAAPHFWTLGVELQFYLTIPFLLIYQNKIGFKKIFTLIFGSFFLIAVLSVFLIRHPRDWTTDQIIFRGVEFGCGIVAARLLMKNESYFKKESFWLITFIIVAFAGRIVISKQFSLLAATYFNLFKLLGFTLLGIGFAGILYLSVTSIGLLGMMLGNRFFRTMGRVSYSFYLWHLLVYPVIGGIVMSHFRMFPGIMVPVATTCICTGILYPISRISYYFLEKPFLSIGNLTTK